ncbi:ATP-dependent protease ATPase subunit HslU [Clostridium formicaceticum]|uniref:ATP-dependent protease ATPase subunit HslU n=1 Tax=Clostridium formicaceticum TaxID=1497 RepID=A0AAC9WGI8_9CLOT|nr:ATP-dependent protease ATPase subunit HslU [Clostridium formicaceticum]AOY77327.1 HslU--HslV peptidase ATPase subunit [Clostridium formicaceticum]ARE87871.1 ATP-dependent protease ATPase subunit ClpY [Clostridium formicaceticum]
MKEFTPRQVVEELDKYIIGQQEAKKAVAIALRNRVRRSKVSCEFQEEIKPKNILMIGPTGVGKTEIARRLAKLTEAPFVKVEATKFTEVGYVGRDVESMIRDLVEASIRIIKEKYIKKNYEKAKRLAQHRLLDLLDPAPRKEASFKNPFEMLFKTNNPMEEPVGKGEYEADLKLKKQQIEKQLKEGLLENVLVEVEMEDRSPSTFEIFAGGNEEMNINLQDMLGGIIPKKTKRKKVTVTEARKILIEEEAQKLVDMDEVITTAVNNAEQQGIIFIDEIDKIAGSHGGSGPDVSREGVQRDILPIIEGSTVMTKYGPVRTDHILFIAAGAFHIAKVSDLIPELQGRFPIRVGLNNLTIEDFKKILTQPQNALLTQYKLLLETEGIKIHFLEEAIDEIAMIAYISNEQGDNIGARRLHTITEKMLEDISFEAPELLEKEITIDKQYVKKKLDNTVKTFSEDKYII